MTKLLVVESPTKAKTINRYVGKDFKVLASVGHVKDLPKTRMGIDFEHGFKMELEVIRGKKKVLQELRQAAKKAEEVLLAPDPDREGEAIAWHIFEELSQVNPNVQRVTFNEITRRAVQEAILHPRPLDHHLVDAQQARRVLDRLVGYELSPLLWDKVRRGLSAGRVQSVAVRLVVERELEIEAFRPQEYWTIDVDLSPADTPAQVFTAQLHSAGGERLRPECEADARALSAELSAAPARVAEVERKERVRRASAPFITSRLQQAAAASLRFSAKKTMVLAQQLYEGVEIEGEQLGLITYMRTDSTRVAGEAITEVRDFIQATHGRDFLPAEPNQYKAGKGAQDAHEAIRPTDVRLTPERVRASLDGDQLKLYDLIWRQFVASQMAPARFDQTSVHVAAGRFELRASGSLRTFPGWQIVAQPGKEDEEEGRELPALQQGQPLGVQAVRPEQHFTQPPPRFTEGTLVKELEERGIGRPSTYAAIMDTVQGKAYVEKREGRLAPTDLGRLVTELLIESFPGVVSVDFTAGMETKLDEVEAGRVDWVALVSAFYEPFKGELEHARTHMRDVKREEIPTEHRCELCGGVMVIRWGRNGFFLACSAYPKCKNTREIKSRRGNQVELAPLEETGEVCEKCGKPMIIRRGRFGRFLACSGYPECKTARPLSTGVACPVCKQGTLVERRSKRGKLFFSCGRYPECTFSLWNPPLAEACPQCGFGVLMVKETKREGRLVVCPQKGCGYKRQADPESA
ncbi:MAG TPA: type I DNA topoisomerase [Myxococcota bacterium]|nr:type I DNA topoisomerase [Myxococcota bacterium]HRY94776.1 type I DNA topoisomerase [Myxococcota bacterium]HSA22697.1 type I DNA topoisomerase [Myxococcota bacterium]